MNRPIRGQLLASTTSALRLGEIAVDESGALALSVDGVVQNALWHQLYVPTLGDAVAFVVTTTPEGQSTHFVVGSVSQTPASSPDEARVTSVTTSSGTITVAAGGETMTAKIVGTAPAVGDIVLLDHRPTAIYALGRVQPSPERPAAEPDQPGPEPPPAPPESGTRVFGATDSGTARTGSSWYTPAGHSLTQGDDGESSYAGAWFYGTSPAYLAGRTITAARLYVPARRRLGAYDAPATIGLYAHTSPSRPPGDVSRVAGPRDVVLPAGWGGGWIEIPSTLAAVVVAGGGLSISGHTYAGLLGRDSDPQSGALAIDWAT